jgi:hypothetical protein
MNNFLSRQVAPHISQLAVQYEPVRRPALDLLRLIFFSMVFVAHTPRLSHLGWVMGAGGNGGSRLRSTYRDAEHTTHPDRCSPLSFIDSRA